jgi:hypothetical protein
MTLSGKIRFAFGLGMLCPLVLSSQTAAEPDNALERVAISVSDLDIRRQLSSATPATIDSLLAYYSDSVVYEHPSVGAIVRSKASLRTC